MTSPLLADPAAGPAPARPVGSRPVAGGPVMGVDVGSPTVAAADTAAAAVVAALQAAGLERGAVVATHLTRLGGPHATLSVELPAPASAQVLAELLAAALPEGEQTEAALAGAAAHAARTGGRAVHFPGLELLVGRLPVHEVLACSAIEDVRVLGVAEPPDPETVLLTRDHVRPLYRGGRLVLPADRAAGGTLVPFEHPSPKPCCADHA